MRETVLSEDQVLERLRLVCKRKTQRRVASDAKVSVQYLNDMVRGRKPITEPVLAKIGVTRHVVYILSN
jgi:hypothetical protein